MNLDRTRRRVPAQPPAAPLPPYTGPECDRVQPIDIIVRHLQPAQQLGVHIFEVCGGVGCPKLMEAMEAGIAVSKYTYVDIGPNEHVVVRAFVAKIHLQYPHLLP